MAIRFAVIDQSQVVEMIFEDYPNIMAIDQARKYCERRPQLAGDCTIQPIMTLDEYLKQHKDFKGIDHGRPNMLYYDNGTVLGWIYLIEGWDAYQMWTGKKYSEHIKAMDIQDEIKAHIARWSEVKS